MLVICEDCAKKYNIDESRIKGNRARFTCNECGHIIIVDKADFSRSLISSAAHQSSSSSSIDLLKEMEAPLLSKENSERDAPGQTNNSNNGSDFNKSDVTKNKGLSITAYFLIAGALSFFITNAGIGYILLQHYSKIASQQMELHSGMLITSILVLLGSWVISFIILFGIGAYLSKTVNRISDSLNRINQGEKELEIVVKGPKELINMAQIVSSMCYKNR
jgi:methyl-accepting chemotaxis protein